MDWIPIVSQCKSLVQAMCGDLDGARETQDRFSKQCPVVSQARSAVHSAYGDQEQARQVQMEQLQLLENLATSMPVAGHIASGIAAVCGDDKRACQYAKAASRSTAIIGGALVGGPAGAVMMGAAYDAAQYGIEKGIHGEADLGGIPGLIDNMVKCEDQRKQGGNAVDLVTCIIGDGILGKSGAKAAKNAANVAKAISSEGTSSITRPPGGAPPRTGPSGPGTGGASASSSSGPSGASKISSGPGTGGASASSSSGPSGASKISSGPRTAGASAISSSGSSSASKIPSARSAAATNAKALVAASTAANCSTSRQTDNRTPGKPPVAATTEEQPEDGKKRRFVNVHDRNMEQVGAVMRATMGALGREFIYESIREMNAAIREVSGLHRIFIGRLAPTVINVSPDPRPGVIETAFSGPLTQGEAKCRIGAQGGHETVCVKEGNRGQPCFTSMRDAGGKQHTGFSWRARDAYMTQQPPDRYVLMLNAEAEILDDIRAQNGAISMRMNHPDYDPTEPPNDSCAEHHAAFTIYSDGGRPVSSIAFRIDKYKRVYSVHRCHNCMPYDLGVVWTDQLPMNTWLNPPRKLDVYVD